MPASRPTTARGPQPRVGRRTGMVAVAVAGVLLAAAPALADRTGDAGPVPSREEVREARSEARSAAVQVPEIQAELVLANQQLEDAAVRAEQAFEAYNGAQWRVHEARAAVRQATRDARRAIRQVAAQRDVLAGVVASS